MKALVTGIAGFIGSSIAFKLIEDGHEVRGLDNLATGFRENIPQDAEFIEGDIVDPDAALQACRGVDVVFHQAAIRSVPRSVDEPFENDRVNIRGTLTMLSAAAKAGVGKVVYASSSSVYGDPADPFRREIQAPDPVSPYAVSKLAGEHYCRTWTALHGLPTVSLRYFNVYGPRQHPDSKYSAVFPAFASALLTGVAPVVHWDGEQSRDFTYIDDVVNANLLAASAPPTVDGGYFNIGGGRTKTVNEVLREIADAAGVWIEPTFEPKRSGDVRATSADIAKARDLLGWEPKAEWQASVRTFVEWMRTRVPSGTAAR